MVVTIEPLEPWHLTLIQAQNEQLSEVSAQGTDMPGGQAWAVLVNGHPVAAGGFVQIWVGRWYAWGLFGKWWPVKSVFKAIRSKLARANFPRLEMAVDVDFLRAAVFAERLGFEWEVRAKRYLPNGHDAHIYVRTA